MNYYENKVLEDREHRIIATGVVVTIFALPIAAIFAGFVAIVMSSASSVPFYVLWAMLELLGIACTASGIKEKVDRKHNQNS
jgi:ethanolamine transporter EutH